MTTPEARLAQAKFEAEQARKRLVATAEALQVRLKPANLANNAWEGVREKSGELAEDAIQAVKERPVKASSVAAGIALFLARDSIWSAVSSLWNRRKPAEDEVTADLDSHDENYDLTAPAVNWSTKEGVNE